MTNTSTPAGPPPGTGPQTADDTPLAGGPPPAYGPPPPPRQGSSLDDLFARLRGLDVRRDTDRRWFGGVCAGLAARFGVDPLLIRAGAIALTIAGGLGLGVYLVLWLLLPDRYETVLAERAVRHGDVWPVVLVVLTGLFVVGSVISVAAGGDGPGGPYWLLVPVGLVVWILATRSRPAVGAAPGSYAPPPPPAGSSPVPPAPGAAATYATPYGTSAVPTSSPAAPYGAPTVWAPPPAPPAPAVPLAPPPPPRPRRRRPSGYVGLVSLGVAVALGALGAILAGPLGFPGEPAVLGFTFALVGVSAIVLGLALSGRASGFSGFLVIVLAGLTALGVLVAHSPAPRSGGVGDRTWSPTAGALPAAYALGAGDATLDLDGLADLPTPTGTPSEVRAELGAGELTIEIPAGLTVLVESHTGIGEIRHEKLDASGSTVVEQQNGDDRTYRAVIGEGTPDVVVRTEVGFGDTIIEEN